VRRRTHVRHLTCVLSSHVSSSSQIPQAFSSVLPPPFWPWQIFSKVSTLEREREREREILQERENERERERERPPLWPWQHILKSQHSSKSLFTKEIIIEHKRTWRTFSNSVP